MYGIYGGGLGGAGIAQNTYYTVPSYIDNSSGSNMLNNYTITQTILTLQTITKSSGKISLVNNRVTSGGELSGNQRVNIDLGTSYKLSTFEFALWIRSGSDPASTI